MATVAKSDRSTLITLASATAGPFDLDFRLFDTDKLDVFVNYVARTDWTLNATFVDGYTDDAAITFDADLDPGDVIVINGELFPHRSQNYLNSGGLVQKLNIEFGRIWSSLSEQYRNNRRSLRFFQPVDPVRLEAGKSIITNGAGDGVEMGPTADEIASAQEYAEAASTSAEAAESSSEDAAVSAETAGSHASDADQSATDAEQAKNDAVASLANKVSKSGDTVTGEIVFDGGLGPVLSRLDPTTGDTLGYVRVRTTDGINIRTRNLIRAVATDDADIPGGNYPWKGVLSYMPPNQGGGYDGVEWDELGLRSRAFGGQFEYHLITPYGWGAEPGFSGASNDPWFGVMEQYLGGRKVDLMGLAWPVTHVPDLPGAENGFWSIEDAGGQPVLYPAASTLRTAKSVLAAPLAYCSWAQNNGSPGVGREKFVAFTVAENHGSSYNYQSAIAHSDGDHWSLDYLWGPGDLSSALGWYITGLAFEGDETTAGGVLYAAVRAENSGGSSDDTHHLFGQSMGGWADATDVLSTQSGLANLYIDRADLSVYIREGDVVQISDATGFGGLTAGDINGFRTVTAVNGTNIILGADAAATSTVNNAGGTIRLRIRKQEAGEITFVGGLSLGDALAAHDGGDVLSNDPTMIHGITVEKPSTNNAGRAWITWSGQSDGGNNAIGVAALNTLRRGANEAQVTQVTEITGVNVDTTEPSLVIVEGGTYDGYHIVTTRIQDKNDGWQLIVSDDEWATAGTVTTGSADFVTRSPMPICQIGDYIFGTCTGGRGDSTKQGKGGFRNVNVYLCYARIEDLVTTGAAAMNFVKVDEAQEWNHASGLGETEASPVGVGTITPMGDHVCIYYSQSRRLENPAQPMAETLEMKVDVTRWIGGAPAADLSPTESPDAYKSVLEYTGTGAIAEGNAFNPGDRRVDTMPGDYDPATGIFTPRKSGHFKATTRAYFTSDGTARSLRLHFASGGSGYSSPYGDASNQFIVWQNLPADSLNVCEGSATYYLEAGVGVYFEVADGSIQASTTRNSLRWEYVL
ncbi:hypothetical protein [Tritonibacter mobilis]|uniref:hypothetical protein n=1 Tax=Tritonibacter mobilis TaxID=379347 RepID=UPI000806E587|nr:hypothetical protein [Tritonibacter mobilis]